MAGKLVQDEGVTKPCDVCAGFVIVNALPDPNQAAGSTFDGMSAEDTTSAQSSTFGLANGNGKSLPPACHPARSKVLLQILMYAMYLKNKSRRLSRP